MQARLFSIVVASALGLATFVASAQSRPPTTEQLGKDPGALRQEAEQQRSQQQQSQQQQSQRQADQQWNDTVRQQQSRANADMAQAAAVRRSWEQRPALAPDRNPLLGRWESLGAGQQRTAAGVPPEMAALAAQLLGGITAGMCDSMLGRGTIEFRPTGVVAIGHDGRERPMYRAEYRGGGSRVVVLPQGGTTFTHMIIDFSGSDRATVAAVGCGLRRAGGDGARHASLATPAAAVEAPAATRWTLLGSSVANGGMDVYVARSTIRVSGTRAEMVDLYDFKQAHAFQGRSFLSARNQYEYDCGTSRRRLLSTAGFAGHMAQGAVVASDGAAPAWEEVGTSGPLHEMWKVACTRQ